MESRALDSWEAASHAFSQGSHSFPKAWLRVDHFELWTRAQRSKQLRTHCQIRQRWPRGMADALGGSCKKNDPDIAPILSLF